MNESTGAPEPGPECEPASGHLWVIVVTLCCVAILAAVFYLLWKYYWRIKSDSHLDLVLVTDIEKGKGYSFDNPGFKDGTPVAEKKKPNGDNVNANVSTSKKNVSKMANGGHPKPNQNEVQKSPENQDGNRKVVPLLSRDFTGLGFDIRGNQKEGIFVKDLLNKGPALQSGLIKSGDRIAAIRVNFSHIVYEDAVAILSYASPYEVEVEVENSTGRERNDFYKEDNYAGGNDKRQFYRDQQRINVTPIQDVEHPAKLFISQSQEMKPEVRKCETTITVVNEMKAQKTCPDSKDISKEIAFKMETRRSSPSIISNDTISLDDNVFGFDEVDLSSSSEKGNKSISKNANGESNVKSILAKGFQNIKEKIRSNNVIAKTPKTSAKTSEENRFPSLERSISSSPEVSSDTSELKNQKMCDEISQDFGRNDSCDSTKSKRKAPMPPERRKNNICALEGSLYKEIEKEISKNRDEEYTKIQLGASNVTVHHEQADDSSRKATSLEDLSKFTNGSSNNTPLERALSLELEDNSNKKRQAPVPSDDLVASSMSTIEPVRPTLKKASDFGTLEDALDNADSISVVSIPNDVDIVSLSNDVEVGSISNDVEVASISNDVEIASNSKNVEIASITNDVGRSSISINDDITAPDVADDFEEKGNLVSSEKEREHSALFDEKSSTEETSLNADPSSKMREISIQRCFPISNESSYKIPHFLTSPTTDNCVTIEKNQTSLVNGEEGVVSSTPMKSRDEVAGYETVPHWDSIVKNQHDSLISDESGSEIPALPTSPIPTFSPSYITEIAVAQGDVFDESTLFTTAYNANDDFGDTIHKEEDKESSQCTIGEESSDLKVHSSDSEHKMTTITNGESSSADKDKIKVNGQSFFSETETPPAKEIVSNQKNSSAQSSQKNPKSKSSAPANNSSKKALTIPKSVKSPQNGIKSKPSPPSKLPKLSPSTHTSPTKLVVSRIPVRSNTETNMKLPPRKDETSNSHSKIRWSKSSDESSGSEKSGHSPYVKSTAAVTRKNTSPEIIQNSRNSGFAQKNTSPDIYRNGHDTNVTRIIM